MTDDEYYQFCMSNPDVRIERAADGNILIIPRAGFESGHRNLELNRQLGNWALEDGRGRAFNSSVEYILPNGAAYSPDASWVLRPDFVIELMSPSDRLRKAKAKMQDWIVNGVQLGWLLDPDHRTAYIYRPGCKPEQVVNPERLIGEGLVAGFVLELAKVWAGL
jgi:Uma2 family endonuclease